MWSLTFAAIILLGFSARALLIEKAKSIFPTIKIILIEDILVYSNYDLSFLNGELDTIKKDKINKKLIIDSLDVARNKFPGTSNSLDALCRKFNIDLSRRSKHNALLDCELLREVYINLIDVKEPKFNLSRDNQSRTVPLVKDYNKKIILISDEEKKKHKDFLKSELKKNFY